MLSEITNRQTPIKSSEVRLNFRHGSLAPSPDFDSPMADAESLALQGFGFEGNPGLVSSIRINFVCSWPYLRLGAFEVPDRSLYSAFVLVIVVQAVFTFDFSFFKVLFFGFAQILVDFLGDWLAAFGVRGAEACVFGDDWSFLDVVLFELQVVGLS